MSPVLCRIVPTVFLLAVLGCPGADTIPPTVTVIEPADCDTVQGSVIVRARASDNDRVSFVELLVDGGLLAADSAGDGSIFEFSFSAATLAPDTTHTLTCVAFDPAGNVDTSAAVAVFTRAGYHHSGTITSDETWLAADNPHIVDGGLTVRAKLTVEPGAVVRMSAGSAITVDIAAQGILHAAGNQGSGILFSSVSSQPRPGDWRRIGFTTGIPADTCILRYCTVEYGGDQSQGMLVAECPDLVVMSCTLRFSSSAGIAADSCGLAGFTGSHVSDCTGFPVLVDPDGVGSLAANNTYSGNEHDGVGINCGTVTESALWANLGVPYYVTATVDVNSPGNPTLTIAPGCSLLFADSAALRVGVTQSGALMANGSSGFITFSTYPTATGSWPGIEFWDQADPVRSVLASCVVDRAGGNGVAAVLCYAPVTISATTVSGSGATGVRCLGAGFTQFTNNTVTGGAGCPLSLGAPYVGSIGSGNRLTGNASDSVVVAGGQIQYNSQWRNLAVPYLVTGMVYVAADNAPTLVIDQGTVLAFEQSAGITVGGETAGKLSAVGQPDSITFTGVTAEPGSWQGIMLLRRTMNTSTLDHCRLLYAGAGGLPGIGGILYINACAPGITNNEIAYSTNYCVAMLDCPLDPDSLRDRNWLHDWHPDFEDIFEDETSD